MSQDTCWTLIKSTADEDTKARSLFANNYLPVVRAYLASRWKGTSFSGDIVDAVQDVFLECYRSSGVLDHADPEHGGGFRAALPGKFDGSEARHPPFPRDIRPSSAAQAHRSPQRGRVVSSKNRRTGDIPPILFSRRNKFRA